jgi:hypothetical protein
MLEFVESLVDFGLDGEIVFSGGGSGALISFESIGRTMEMFILGAKIEPGQREDGGLDGSRVLV